MQNTHARLKAEMHVYKAHVKDGKIELDEPAELPEGTEVEVHVKDELEGVVFLDNDDDLSLDEKKELVASTRRAFADAAAGREMDMEDFLRELESEP